MSLASGTKLGPYEILSPLGAGGMGEVYKAKDTRLDRTVAIKVLPSHLSDNARLKERFEREARAVSSLNHPHICTLFDVGSENGVDFMVMEHIDGETLADRLRKGALPLDQALRYAVEIADALDKAHRQGVVHRDLKPGNIMLTKSGAKLLDFGLAKLAVGEVAPLESALPTQQRSLTAEGSIPGRFSTWPPSSWKARRQTAARTCRPAAFVPGKLRLRHTAQLRRISRRPAFSNDSGRRKDSSTTVPCRPQLVRGIEAARSDELTEPTGAGHTAAHELEPQPVSVGC